MEAGETVLFPRVVTDMKAAFKQEIEVHFFFICLLHLANEHGLKIEKNAEGSLLVRKKHLGEVSH